MLDLSPKSVKKSVDTACSNHNREREGYYMLAYHAFTRNNITS